MEVIDLVNEQDEIIGITDKTTAHTTSQLHRVASVYVFLADGTLLVQHRKSSVLDHSVGGHVRSAESYEQAAIREAYEELRVTSPLSWIGKAYSEEILRNDHVRSFIGIFACRVDQSWKFTPTEEVDMISSMHIADIVNTMNRTPEKFAKGFIHTMKVYLKEASLPYSLHTPSMD
jgi:isopentenyldiphosphate isomerase